MMRTTRVRVAPAILLSLTTLAAVLIASTHGVAAAYVREAPSSADLGDYAEGVVDITLGDTANASGAGVSIDGSTVKITAAGVYSISGTLANGRIEVDAKGKVYLELGGVDITSASGPALMITDAKKATITLVEGTTNTLTDTAGEDEYDAALFTNDTLVINGRGTLVVCGNNNEGISSDDDIIINAGTIKVTAVDDALNAHDDITITDGYVYLIAGGDGLDSNGTVNIAGGTIFSFGGTAGGDGGLDAIGALTITGGTLIAGGSSIAAPSSESRQCSIYGATGSTQPAGTTVTVMRNGKEILSFTPAREYQNILISSSDLIADATYRVQVGSSGTAFDVAAAITPAGAGSLGAPGGAAAGAGGKP